MTKKKKINIGKIIRNGRMRKGISQKELADLMQVRPSLISKWERDLQVPRGDYLIKLANILDIIFDLFPNANKVQSPKAAIFKLQKEVKNIQQAIIQKEQEEADFKKIILLLLKEKLAGSDSVSKS